MAPSSTCPPRSDKHKSAQRASQQSACPSLLATTKDAFYCPLPNKLPEPACREAALWAELAPEHLLLLGCFLLEPLDVCHLEEACRIWCRALRRHAGAGDIWQRMCTQWYPSMAARIFKEGFGTASMCSSPSLPPYSPPMASESSPASSSNISPFPVLPPAPDLLESLATGLTLPDPAIDVESMMSELAPSCDQWRETFKRRFSKQQSWDAHKLRSRRHAARETNGSGVDITFRNCRTRACKRCGVSFDCARERGKNAVCHWHPGRFAAFRDNGSEVVTAQGSKGFDRRAQHLIKLENRKKKSKKANMVVFGAACESGVASEDGVAWRWSCCFNENLVAQGCMEGSHQ